MPEIETAPSNVTLQELHNARINPFALKLLVESYRNRPTRPPLSLLFDGVLVSLAIPGTFGISIEQRNLLATHAEDVIREEGDGFDIAAAIQALLVAAPFRRLRGEQTLEEAHAAWVSNQFGVKASFDELLSMAHAGDLSSKEQVAFAAWVEAVRVAAAEVAPGGQQHLIGETNPARFLAREALEAASGLLSQESGATHVTVDRETLSLLVAATGTLLGLKAVADA